MVQILKKRGIYMRSCTEKGNKSVKKSTPFNKKEVKNDSKAFKNTEKSIKPVAKDTNKTRRKDTLLPLKNAVKKKTKP
jgi:hypothetical protein